MAALTIYILTTPSTRGDNLSFHALTPAHDIVQGLLVSSNKKPSENKLSKKLAKGKFVVLHNYSLTANQEAEGNSFLRIQDDSSKVYQTGSGFKLKEEVLHRFYNAPLATVPEALASPKKRRLSIEGTVSQVYPIRTGATWKRRDLMLEDPKSKTKICCKLWGDLSEAIQDTDQGVALSLKNMEVDKYKDKIHLQTTDISDVKICVNHQPSLSGQFELVGVDEEGETVTVITSCGKVWTLPKDVMDLTCEELIEKTPVTATVTVNEDVIQNITF